jgi:hypothetical protein
MPHTPGPWLNDEGVVSGQDSRVRFVRTPSIDIFNAHEWPAGLHQEAMANAHLIAAAPDMLAALKDARRIIIAAVTLGVDLPEFDPAEHSVVRQIDTVIAKATGGLA